MIIGAKKKKELKNDDKNEISICINSFKKFILNKDEIINKDNLIEIGLSGDVDKNLIRPIIWKTFLNVLPINDKVEEWIPIIIKQRNTYKNKLKNLNALKKFSGDPLGGSGDVKIKIYY
jgi:hypothetical protein